MLDFAFSFEQFRYELCSATPALLNYSVLNRRAALLFSLSTVVSLVLGNLQFTNLLTAQAMARTP